MLQLNYNKAEKYDDFALVSDNNIYRLSAQALKALFPSATRETIARHIRDWRSETYDLFVEHDELIIETDDGEICVAEWDVASWASEEAYQAIADDYYRELEAWKVKGNLINLNTQYVIFDAEGFVRDRLIEDHFGGITKGMPSAELFPKFSNGDLAGSFLAWKVDN